MKQFNIRFAPKYMEHLKRVVRKIASEQDRPYTVSQLVRDTLQATYPMERK